MSLSRKEIGILLRNRRKELKKRQIDLVDEVLSLSSISNIERGKNKVGKKTIAHLCSKLGLEYDKLDAYKRQEEKNHEIRLFRLKLLLNSIETELDFVKLDKKIYSKLAGVKLEENHPYTSVVQYLLGKYFYKQEKYESAKVHFLRALELYNEFPELKDTNIKSACLYELGRIYHIENDLNQAMTCVNDGLKSFVENGERKYYKYHLLISKVIYLEKLELLDEAIDTLEKQMWPYIAEIGTETQLNMYELQATLFNKKRKYEDAIKFAYKGIELARLEKNYDRCFELWTTLGVSYKHLGDIESAKLCFQTASSFEDKLRKKYLLPAKNYTELGLLHIMEKNFELAQPILEEAVKLSKKSRDGLRQFEAYNALGDCLLCQQKILEAIAIFEEAKRIAEAHPSFKKYEQKIVLKLAQYYKDINTTKHQKYFARFYEISVQLLNGGEEFMLQQNTQLQPPTERNSAGDPPDG